VFTACIKSIKTVFGTLLAGIFSASFLEQMKAFFLHADFFPRGEFERPHYTKCVVQSMLGLARWMNICFLLFQQYSHYSDDVYYML